MTDDVRIEKRFPIIFAIECRDWPQKAQQDLYLTNDFHIEIDEDSETWLLKIRRLPIVESRI